MVLLLVSKVISGQMQARSWIVLFGIAAVSHCALSQIYSPDLDGTFSQTKSLSSATSAAIPSGRFPAAGSLAASTPLIQNAGLSQAAPEAVERSTQNQASPYIPLDSWIFPVFDRLAALGYIPDSTAMVRPWTRLEGARLLAEAHEHLFEMDDAGESLLASLDKEFINETRVIAGAKNDEAQVESAYTRFSGIGGTPLRDGYHFSQTLVNDFGRPYGQGANEISGLAARANAGPLTFYFRGEYQYASVLPMSIYNVTAQQALSSADALPFGWNLRYGDTNRVRPIEAYVSLKAHNWQLIFGQQALWWGPDRSTSLILSNNADSLPMLRLDRTQPGYLPGWLRSLGPIRFDIFMARMGGVHFYRQAPTYTTYGSESMALNPPPYLWGVHMTIKPTENFELGLAHTTIFAGYGRPLTFGTFFHTFSSDGNGQPIDPGKRVTEVNLNYHIPGFRRAIQVYSEGMAWDNPVQGKFVSRFAWDPGIYLSELPKFHNFDARFEAVYTDLPKLAEQGYFYANARYAQGYTNYGQILGSWVGRQGIGGQASTTYWFSPQKKAGFFYRKMVSDVSLTGGGRNSDYGVNASWRIRPEIELNALGQYESWKFPILQQTSRSNFTGSAEIRFYPATEFRSHHVK
jgi:hypothetical protein